MNNKRLKILSKSEINELYAIPRFNANERAHYFALSKKEYRVMRTRGTLASKVHLILQLGYFKAMTQFFDFTFDKVKNDVDYILQQHLANSKLHVNSISQNTCKKNQELIASHLGYNIDNTAIKTKLEKFLETKTRLSANPVYLFHEILCYCDQHKLMLLT